MTHSSKPKFEVQAGKRYNLRGGGISGGLIESDQPHWPLRDPKTSHTYSIKKEPVVVTSEVWIGMFTGKVYDYQTGLEDVSHAIITLTGDKLSIEWGTVDDTE